MYVFKSQVIAVANPRGFLLTTLRLSSPSAKAAKDRVPPIKKMTSDSHLEC